MSSSKSDNERKFFDVHASKSHPRFTRKKLREFFRAGETIDLKPQFRMRHPFFTAAGILAVVVLIVLGLRQISTRAEVSDFYPSICLGDWQDPVNAAGQPETMAAGGAVFSGTNSAVFNTSGTQIFCGGFVPPAFSSSGTITNVGLTLVWQVGDTPIENNIGAPVVTSGGGSSPDNGTSTSADVSTSTATTSSPPITPSPTSTPSDIFDTTTGTTTLTTSSDVGTDISSTPADSTPPPPSDTSVSSGQSSFAPLKNIFAFLVGRAFADDASSSNASSTDSTTIIIAPPISASLTPISASLTPISASSSAPTDSSSTASSSPSELPSAVPAPAPDENFLQISYSTDGSTWIPIQEVSENNWQNLTITLPVTDWSDLAKLQVRIAAIPTSLDVLPPVYLDGMLMEAHYTVTPFVAGGGTPGNTTQDQNQNPGIPVIVTPPEQFAPVGSSTNFSATQAPTFDFDLNSLPAPASSASATTTDTSSAPQSFNDHHSGNAWGDFFYSLLDRLTGRADAQTAGAPPVPTPQNPVVAEIDDSSGQATNFQPVIATVNDQLSVGLPEPTGDFTPGRYTLKMWILRNGVIYATENSFTWGVLVVNFDKSIYTLNDTAHIGIGVLTDDGHTVCGALIAMTVTAPDGTAFDFNTSDGTIKESAKCGQGTVTNIPDYSASLSANQVGTYQVSVTATTGSGPRTITDQFEVQNPPLFDVTRLAPTRIFPPVLYTVSLVVNANTNFSGNITETAPASFGITGNFSQQSSDGTTQTLTWPAKLKKGDSMTLSYIFKAPDVSPELYKLGPLQIGSWQETRQWQIAADAISNTIVIVTSTASTTWIVPIDWSASNTIELIGGGGGGRAGVKSGGTNEGGAGGGGGAYAEITNFSTSTGNSIRIQVGKSGASNTSGTVSYFNWSNSGSTSTCSSGTMGACAMAGQDSGAQTTAGAGGASSTSVGTTRFPGGSGGVGSTTASNGGGGGGAAGSHGAGSAGLATATSTGGAADNGTVAGGAINTNGNSGTEWTTAGSGSGAGGADVNTTNGLLGGSYGGGGSGGKGTSSGGAGAQGVIVITYTPTTITLGDGTQNAPVTIGPSGATTTDDIFNFQTNFGTSSISNVTIGMSTTTGVAKVLVTDSGGTTVYGSSTNPGSTTLHVTTTAMNVSTTLTTFKIQIVPLSYANMPLPDNAIYTVTSTVAGWTDGKSLDQSGAQATSSIVYIDNEAPADVINVSGTAGNGQVALSWTNPGDSDFADTVVLRSTSTSQLVSTTTYGGVGASPYFIAFDGTNMWTANFGGNSVTKITPTGVTTTYGGTANNPAGIAFDGTNMWTANYSSNSVTKITPAGATTTYNGTGANPYGIAFDGTNMWTANNGGSSVTKITPAGATTTYNGTGANPYGIAFDGTHLWQSGYGYVSGNMWTANFGGNSVTKITPTGATTTYGGTGTNPIGIAFDGTNMWTANYGSSSVTKITPAGATTTYNGTGANPFGIAFDGTNMWTANYGSSSVTKITPTGVMTTYNGTGIFPFGIAFDGTNIWTANFGDNSVTKVTINSIARPVEGISYSVGQTIGSSTVVCVVASSTSNCTDTGLTNGTSYNYEIFTTDNYKNYSVGVAPSGTPFTPSAAGPVLSNTALNGASAISLVPNATDSISVAASTTAGGSALSFATGTIYRTSLGANCGADNLDCYQIASSSCIFSGSTTTVACSAPLWYFAQSTGDASSSFPSDSWTGAITLTDNSGATSTATSSIQNVNVLTAINVTTSSINYGTITPSSTTGAVNQAISVQNVGNSSSTLQLSGTAFVNGAINFATSSQHYATTTFTFGGSEQALSDTLSTVSGFILSAPTSTTGGSSNSSSSVYFGLKVPSGVSAGSYIATTTFSSAFSN